MLLSVIVVIVDGGVQLDRCLAALATQADAPPLDVIVPWDDSVAGIQALASRYPHVRFLALGGIRTDAPAGSYAGLHEMYDRRRTAGLHAATGDVVAMLEDRSVPAPSWARATSLVHAERPNLVIGGTLANGRTTLLGRADYLCDFYRFQPPQPAGARDYVSYVNISYKREALERTRAVWSDTYYDLAVHRALQQDGEELWLAPEVVARQERSDGTRLATLLGERFAWGRLFGARRVAAVGGRGRLRFALQAPVIPLLLWLRVMRGQVGAAAVARALVATPALLLIFGAWAGGELAGTLRGTH